MKSKMPWLLLATVSVMVGFSSCDKNDEPTGPDNIAGIVANNPSFSILNNAINRAGLGSALSGGALTLFAPDNAAFEASGITNATVNALPTVTTAKSCESSPPLREDTRFPTGICFPATAQMDERKSMSWDAAIPGV
jgi:hypothetical protein